MSTKVNNLIEVGMKSTVLRNAIVRPPGENFAEGITTASLGVPIYEKALKQHAGYCRALARCGLHVTLLGSDLRHPDSTFVEDAAVLTGAGAILTRPSAESRVEEPVALREPLARFFPVLREILAPGTLEGGDICETGGHFFIGISRRTNQEGRRQLAALLALEGYTSSFVDIRGVKGILHLKSGISYVSDNNLVVVDELGECAEFRRYNLIRVRPEERFAANCLRVNEYVLLAAGCPGLRDSLERLGYKVLELDLSEFWKMDGGLSCLSLRF
jgi:dimethylargininase